MAISNSAEKCWHTKDLNFQNMPEWRDLQALLGWLAQQCIDGQCYTDKVEVALTSSSIHAFTEKQLAMIDQQSRAERRPPGGGGYMFLVREISESWDVAGIIRLYGRQNSLRWVFTSKDGTIRFRRA